MADPKEAAGLLTLAHLPLQQRVAVPNVDKAIMQRFAALGFAFTEQGDFLKVVDLWETAPLVPTRAAALPQLGAVAMLYVERPVPYIFATLRSAFDGLDAALQINVLVGDERADSLRPEVLRAELGARLARQVHVVAPSAAVGAFLRDHHAVGARATWNYARALRSYAGSGHLLVLEDDVEVAVGGGAALARWLERPPAEAISLYNYLGAALPGASPAPWPAARLLTLPMCHYPGTFARTQAMLYAADLTPELGRFLALRLGVKPYDHLIDAFLRQRGASLATAEPSMVQHTGKQTTGLGLFHTSPCYAPAYPPG